LALLGALALCAGRPCLTGRAHAQGLATSAAQTLFDEGRALMEKHDFKHACSKFAESQSLEPATGTLLNLALCHERRGALATAWIHYQDALASATREHNQAREGLARERIQLLEQKLARLVVMAPAEPPKGLWVQVDGVSLGEAAWGVELPVDPGSHQLKAGAPGCQEVLVHFDIGAPGTRRVVTVPALSLIHAAKLVSPAPSAPVQQAELPGRFITGAALGGVSLAAFGVAGFLGSEAKHAWSVRNEHCQAGCDETAESFGDQARRLAIAFDVSLGAALVSAGVATYLMVSGRKELRSRVRVGANFAHQGAPAALAVAGGEF
jgi:hypothetical protein